MAIQKNFVVKNGIEVSENLIFADKNQDTVGIGTTVTPEKLQVTGGIGATSLVLTGVGTIPTLQSTTGTITNLTSTTGSIVTIRGTTLGYDVGQIVSGVVTSLSGSTLNYSGIATVGSVSIGNTEVVSSVRQLKNIVSLDAVTTATIEAAIANAPNTFTDLIVTGVSTLGSVEVYSGIITSSSGIVTYYGDGSNLNLSGNSSTGIGIGTTGGVVGYGVTFVDLRGSGVSTTFYDSSVGIATIFFEGGGSGTIGIGTLFPSASESGDLFFNTNFGRLYVYYDEVALGIGATAVWIDAAPFNQGLIETLSGIAFTTGSAVEPSWYFISDAQTGVFSPSSGEITFVSTGSSVLNINSDGLVITGITTSPDFSGNLTGNVYSTGISTFGNVIVGGNATDLIVNGNTIITGISTIGSVTFNAGNIVGSAATFTGNVSIAGTLTYEDVTNVDSVGLITARSGLHVGQSVSVASTLGTDGGAVFSGIVTALSFSGPLAGDVTGNADSASQIKTNSTSTNSTHYITFVDSNNGSPTNETLYTDAGIYYNPSTNNMNITGDFTASGNVTAYSDENLKENIETISNALEKVKSLRGVEFDRKDLEGNPRQIGVIAQELEKVVPEVVKTDIDGLKSVAYGNLVGLLIEAVKELSEEVDRLKNN